MRRLWCKWFGHKMRPQEFTLSWYERQPGQVWFLKFATKEGEQCARCKHVAPINWLDTMPESCELAHLTAVRRSGG